jgi:hypothetical protein
MINIKFKKWQIQRFFCFGLIFFAYGCISFTPVSYYHVAESYTTSKINRVGILVVRMGNVFPSQTLPLYPFQQAYPTFSLMEQEHDASK